MKQTHNHRVMIAEALRHRPVSDDVRLQFIELFKSGLTPPQALAKHQMALKECYGDQYSEVVVDRFLCPDIHWCYRLYYKLYKTKNGAASETQEDMVVTEAEASEAEAALRRLTDGICRKLRQKPKIYLPVVEKLLAISQSLIDSSDVVAERISADCMTDDEKNGAGPHRLRNLPETKHISRTKRNSRLDPGDLVPRKRARSMKLAHTKEHDYSSVRPAEDSGLIGTEDSKAFAQSILIPASYGGQSVVLSSDVSLNALPESWGIMFGPQCDLPAHVAHFENAQHEGVVTALVTPHDLNDPTSKDTMLDVSMQYDVDPNSTQTYHFISEDNTHVNIVHVNGNQGNDVVGNVVPDLKEFLKCF